MVAFSGDNLIGALQAQSLAELAKTDPETIKTQYSDPIGHELEGILDGYAWGAVQQMAQARGILSRKKSQTVRDLSQIYYDEAKVKQALLKLTDAALGALAYLAQRNGLANMDVLNNIFKERQDKETGLPVSIELVGKGLAFFVQEVTGQLVYNSYQKHDLNNSNFYGSTHLFVPHTIIAIASNTFKLDNYLSSATLIPYENSAPRVLNEASFEAFIADILTLSRYVEQNKARVLQSGALGKRDYVKLNELLRVKEDVSKTSKLSETGRLNVLWNVAVGLNLIVAKPDAVVQVSESAMKFYELPRYQQLRLMLVAWANANLNDFVRVPTLNFFTTSSNNSDIPTQSQLNKARFFLLALLENNLKKNQFPAEWIDFNSLLTLVRENNLEFLISRTRPIPTYYNYGYYGYSQSYNTNQKLTYNGFDSTLKRGEKNKAGYYTPANLSMDTDWNLVEGEYIAQIFREAMVWLGAGELGVDSKNRPVAFSLTELGRAALLNKPSQSEELEAHQVAQIAATAPPELIRPLLMQPNFDLMVLAPFQNLALLRQIDRFADQTSTGDVAMYHLSKETVMRGMRNGLDGSQILKLLNDNSRVPVAQNVQISIQGWNAEFERVVLRPVSNLLEVAEPALLDKICAEPTYAEFIEKRLGATFALIKGDVTKFDSILQELLPLDPDSNTRSNIKKKMTPLIMDYSSLQSGAVKPTGANQLYVKPGYADPYLLYRLGQFADLSEWNPKNQSAVFVLSPDSVKRGQTLDLNYEPVRRFLMTVVGVTGAVSPAMNLALKGWFGFYANEQIRGERAITIQASANLLNDILAVPEFSNYVVARPTATTALIREDGFARLEARLQEWNVRVVAPQLNYDHNDYAVHNAHNMDVTENLPNLLQADSDPEFLEEQYELNPTFTDSDSEPEQLPQLMQMMTALLDEDDDDYADGPFIRNRSKNKRKRYQGSGNFLSELITQQLTLQVGIKALESSNKQERQEAVTLLSSLGTMAARQMVPLLYNPDPKVRYNACIVLSTTGDAESLKHLKIVEDDLSRTDSGTVAEAAQLAMLYIRQRLAR